MSIYGYKTSSNVSFIVQNNSKKKIRIFNYPLLPGQSRDLMKIPNIGEDDIRTSLIKGNLKSHIDTGQITITFSDIDLVEFNLSQQTFLQSSGATNGLQPNSSVSPWLTQTSWFINAVTGSDSNNGNVAIQGSGNAGPLATLSEFFRRVSWPNVINVGMTVLIQTDIPATDLVRAKIAIGPAGSIYFKGVGSTTLYTNSTAGFTASVNRNASTNTAPSVSDTLMGSTFLATILATSGVRYRTTSGTNVGSIAWPMKDLGSENCRVGQWAIPIIGAGGTSTGGPFGQGVSAQKTVAVGDHFVVEQLTKIDNITLDVDIYDNGQFNNAIVFQDLSFVNSAGFRNTEGGASGFVSFYNCATGGVLRIISGSASFINCQLGFNGRGPFLASGVAVNIIGGVAQGAFAMAGATLILDSGFMVQGCGLQIYASNIIYLGDVGSFDSTTSGFEFWGIPNGSQIMSVLGVQALFGSGNTKAGFRIHGGVIVPVNHVLPGGCTVTGTSGDLLIGGGNGTAKTWAQTPVIISDITSGAGTTLSGIVVQ